MEEIVRCAERERARSRQAWGVILTAKPEAAPRRWDRLELNLRTPQAALLARREARKSLPEGKTGRDEGGNKPNEAVDDPRRGKDPRLALTHQKQRDDPAGNCKPRDRRTSKMTR